MPSKPEKRDMSDDMATFSTGGVEVNGSIKRNSPGWKCPNN